MNPQAGRRMFSIPIFLLVCSSILLFLEPRGSAEFSITVVTFIIALLFSAAFVLVSRLLSR